VNTDQIPDGDEGVPLDPNVWEEIPNDPDSIKEAQKKTLCYLYRPNAYKENPDDEELCYCSATELLDITQDANDCGWQVHWDCGSQDTVKVSHVNEAKDDERGKVYFQGMVEVQGTCTFEMENIDWTFSPDRNIEQPACTEHPHMPLCKECPECYDWSYTFNFGNQANFECKNSSWRTIRSVEVNPGEWEIEEKPDISGACNGLEVKAAQKPSNPENGINCFNKAGSNGLPKLSFWLPIYPITITSMWSSML
jgi:hypothetical protein